MLASAEATGERGRGSAAAEQQLGRISGGWRFDIDEFKCPRASAFGVHSSAVIDEADVLQWAASNSEARGLVGQKPIQVVEQKPQSEVFQQTPFQVLRNAGEFVGDSRGSERSLCLC